jgi:hypothetical protein
MADVQEISILVFQRNVDIRVPHLLIRSARELVSRLLCWQVAARRAKAADQAPWKREPERTADSQARLTLRDLDFWAVRASALDCGASVSSDKLPRRSDGNTLWMFMQSELVDENQPLFARHSSGRNDFCIHHRQPTVGLRKRQRFELFPCYFRFASLFH